MGFWSSLGSSISNFASSACSAIGGLCSSIGGALFSGIGGVASIATGIVGAVVGVGLGIPEILLAVAAVAKIVGAIAEILGMKNEEESPEELGMKAEEAEKKPGDFDSTEAYIEYLRKEVEIDKSKLENLKDEDKIKYAAVGSALYIKGIEEKYKMEMPVEFWTSVANMKLEGQEVKVYMDSFKEHKIDNMGDMVGYIKNDLEPGKDKSKISDAMIDALQEINPKASREELYGKLNNLRLD